MLLMEAVDRDALDALLARYGLHVTVVAAGSTIPGSYWGDSEAGLVGTRIYMRPDTPLHSVLHETAHYVCMCPRRRERLHTDAGGDDAEENAVCYLQILLADGLPEVGRSRLCRDMDQWGYSFRLGAAAAWFEADAADARDWLVSRGIIDAAQVPTHRCRSSEA